MRGQGYNGFYFNPEMANFINSMAGEVSKNLSAQEKENIQNFTKFFTGQGQSCGNDKKENCNKKDGKNDGNRGSSPRMNKRKCWFPDQNQKTQEQPKQEGYEEIKIPLVRFKPSSVDVKLNKNGLMTISASNEKIEDTGRNGLRKQTIIIEETCQLPSYLIENYCDDDKKENKNDDQMETSEEKDTTIYPNIEKDNNNTENFEVVENEDQQQKSTSKSDKKLLLSKVTTKYNNGYLVVSYPEKPKSKEEENIMKDESDLPVDIEIEFC